MLSFKNSLGDSSEMFAAFCFICDGVEVARPVSNSLPYDLVAKIDGRWQTVQVKTVSRKSASRRPVASLSLGSSQKGNRRFYTPDDFDVLVAVDPTAMSSWIVPSGRIEFGSSCMTMTDEFAWKHCPPLTRLAAVDRPHPGPLSPEQREALRQAQDPRKCHSSPSKWRQKLCALLAAGISPTPASADTVAMLREYADGYGLGSIAHSRNLHPSTVKERISRAILSMEKHQIQAGEQLPLLA